MAWGVTCWLWEVGGHGQGGAVLGWSVLALTRPEAAVFSLAEPEALLAPSSPQPSPLVPESLEDDSAEAAEGEPEPEAGALGSTNSEPGTPRAGRSAARAGGGSRAERCAGVHISDPYNVNLPLHITSILNVPPNIISNVSLARLTRGLECPALQPRPSPASGPCPGPGPPGEDLGQEWGLDPPAEALMLGAGVRGRGQRPQASSCGWSPSLAPSSRWGNPVLHMKSMVTGSPTPRDEVLVRHRQGD